MACPSCRRPVARTALREARQARGEDQENAAYALGVTPVTLGRWERGETDIRLANRRRIAEHFGAPITEVTSWVDPPCPRCTAATGDGVAAEDAEGTTLSTADTGDLVKVEVQTPDGRIVTVSLSRRQFGELFAVGGLGAFAPGILGGDQAERVANAVLGQGRADREIVGIFARVLNELRATDARLGPGGALHTAESQVASMERLLPQAPEPVRSQLLSVSGQYAELLGWLHRDSGNHTAARRWYDRALALADEADDLPLVSFVFIAKSLHARDRGDASGTLATARAAQRPSLRPTPMLAASGVVQDATGHARAGDAEAMRRKLDEARGLAESGRGGPEPSFVDTNKRDVELRAARCLLEGGLASQASEAFEAELARLPVAYRRTRGYYSAWLGLAHAANREPERAATTGTEALAIAAETGSRRTLAELRRLDDALSPWPTVSAVREFRQALRVSTVVTCVPGRRGPVPDGGVHEDWVHGSQARVE